MKKLIIGLLVMCLLVPVSCAKAPAPVTPPAEITMPRTVPTNSESDSRVAELEAKVRQLEDENQRLRTENQGLNSDVAELEAKIRQLEAENQRLRTENQELNSDLAKLSNWLQDIHNLVTSSDYTQTLSKLPKIQNDASDLATFLSGLPDLPPPPPGLTVAQIDDAINKVRHLRDILEKLPPPPPFAPSWWRDLDDMKTVFIDMTEWMEDLEDLPEFLRVAGDLDDLRSDMTAYLIDIEAILSDVKAILEEVRNTASPH